MVESAVYYKKINRLKNKRSKKKDLRLFEFFKWNDVNEFNDMFIYPKHLFEKSPQLILVPFASYNMAYPFEDTFIMPRILSDPTEERFSLVLYGYNAIMFIEKDFKSINDLEEYSCFIQSLINKAIDTVRFDLNKIPEILWYNNIQEGIISFDTFDDYRDSNKILIMKKSTRTCSNGNIVIKFIDISIDY